MISKGRHQPVRPELARETAGCGLGGGATKTVIALAVELAAIDCYLTLAEPLRP
ncbi:hypothetical protein [Streptomyces sp. NPDC060187]|uniref:hypothetical protein n=1 Tax=Streptomyces sp. NPDC060187 TaxID=3347067 RepID=UPI00365AF2A9